MATKLHSNYEIRWKNFRRFEDTGWVELKPLTILLGSNNAGKSSIISPLLLLSQTLESKDSEVPLLPFGPLIDLGTYKDFVHTHDVNRELFFGMRFHSHSTSSKIKKVGTYPPGGIELTFSAGSTPERMSLKRFEVTDIFKLILFTCGKQDRFFS
ncbi:AAA family ATPase [Polaromonas sp. CF318]|uniref:AAA family ATPase n=1 Tax=Polaromonas sp. CF318 TaxID=1144318 RepID=UPI0009D9A431|nr:AAA family ATPase [Polaromonas sp. CF318]